MQFSTINAHNSALLSTINPFLLEYIWYHGKICNFTHFYMLRNYVNLRTFFNPKNWLTDKNQLFPCLLKDIPTTLTGNRWQTEIHTPFWNTGPCLSTRMLVKKQFVINVVLGAVVVYFWSQAASALLMNSAPPWK